MRAQDKASATVRKLTFALALASFYFLAVYKLAFPRRRDSGCDRKTCSYITFPESSDPMWAEGRFPLPLCCSNTKTRMSTKVLTYAVIYYNDDEFLRRQINTWSTLPSSVADKLLFLVIDDGSMRRSALDVIDSSVACSLDVRLFQVEEDIDWNIGGVRNLAMALSPTEYVFLTDVDVGVSVDAIYTLLSFVQHAEQVSKRDGQKTVFTQYPRCYEDHDVPCKPHPAITLLSKTAYWNVGGCDEDFVGHYGYTDPHFWHRARNTTGIKLVRVQYDYPSFPPLIEYKKSAVRAAVRDKRRNMELFELKKAGSRWSTLYLRFSWREQVICIENQKFARVRPTKRWNGIQN